MEIYKHLLKSKKVVDNYFREKKLCFLDIETTGLSRKYNHIYLIGLIYFDERKDNWYLTQFFANHTDEEEDLLNKFNSFIEKFNLIITYNGDSFDIYRKVRVESPYIDIKNLKLKTIEESLGIFREDEYSGKDCINFYYQYMSRGDFLLKEKILKHNYDDLYYLVDILDFFKLIDDMKTVSVNFNNHKMVIKIKNIIISGDVFNISCNTSFIDENINIAYYQEGFNIIWQSTSMTIDLEVQEGLVTPTKKAIFLNKKIFPYKFQLKDLSQYMVPDNIILLKVEDKYVMDNIKNIIKKLVYYVKQQ
ncbi:ribonuclease H-like domain-containing protein [Clostridium sp. Cult2]|uniref:ribonuclease H-like domain-containing protein n=1 Tax=Clostridium sp. Cult2 TaxID=2079003 RepID=UPI001F456C47|nr:ribonuclease H-like domain-containing protein [Clostridium sp. Cult2]MCF6465700.1 hypothetical protein [Clostridium sp. Cult2]